MLKHPIVICVLLAALPCVSRAVVIQQGVPDSKYVVPDNALPALVDLPEEGHGVLIGKSWVLTAAHATVWYAKLDHVTIGGKDRAVAQVIRYPGYVKPDLGHLSGDASLVVTKLAALDDIALIRLVNPVEDIPPMALYRSSDEQGKMAEIYGKGATGNGLTGERPNSPHRGTLRRADVVVSRAKGRWLDYTFDCGRTALPLEGVAGGGDSGGPVLIRSEGQWKLAGVTSWKQWKGDISTFKAGVCGQVFSNTRVSHYAEWIDQVIVENPSS